MREPKNSIIDRRLFGRRPANFLAWIRIPGKPSQLCTLRDISSRGARLDCEYPYLLPFRFELAVPTLGWRHICEVRHTNAYSVGVIFITLDARETEHMLREGFGLTEDRSKASADRTTRSLEQWLEDLTTVRNRN